MWVVSLSFLYPWDRIYHWTICSLCKVFYRDVPNIPLSTSQEEEDGGHLSSTDCLSVSPLVWASWLWRSQYLHSSVPSLTFTLLTFPRFKLKSWVLTQRRCKHYISLLDTKDWLDLLQMRMRSSAQIFDVIYWSYRSSGSFHLIHFKWKIRNELVNLIYVFTVMGESV